jgi:protein phosphatase 2C family protein 2/3
MEEENRDSMAGYQEYSRQLES